MGLDISQETGSIYIALRVEREPLDQTDLRNSVDAILRGGGGTFWKVLTSGTHRGPDDMHVGLAPHVSSSSFASVWCPLECSRPYPRWFSCGIALFLLTCRFPLMVF
jgi:hypothetical protein